MKITSDQGTHFINITIELLLKKFMIDYKNSIAYHLHANGDVESFYKTLHKGLKKVCGLDRDD
jgi:transposase InsO family protein